MRRAVAPLLFLAVLVAVVVAWPRSQEPGSAGDSTTRDAAPAGPPRLAASQSPRPATPAGATTAPTARPPLPFRIEVFGEAGPLAGAVVSTEGGAPLGTTDATGSVSVSSPAAGTESWVRVVARHAGYAPAGTFARRADVCHIVLAPGGSLRGRVVLGEGDVPVPGARIVVSPGGAFPGTLAEAVTDAVGAFEVADVPRDVAVDFVVRAPGRAVVRARGKVGEDVLVRLAEGAILEGFVLDGAGRPLSSVEVLVLKEDDPLPLARPSYEPDEVHRTTTDAAGRYEIAGLPVLTALVAVALETPTLYGRSEPATFAHVGERIRRDVLVPKAGALRVVVAEPAGIAGADRSLLLRGAGVEVQVTAAQRTTDGSWEFPRLTPGRYDVKAFAMGTPFVGRSTDVESGKTTEVRLSFRGDRTIEGRVTSEDGTGVAHAHVWWVGGTRSVAVTDEDGHFHFGGLDEAPGMLIAQLLDGPADSVRHGRAVREGHVPGSPRPVTLVLDRSPTVRVRVTGVEPGATVWYEIRTRVHRSIGGRGPAKGAILDVPVDVVGVPVQVVLRAPDRAPASVELSALVPGEVRDVGEVRLDAGRVVPVRVVDAAGAGVVGAGVRPGDADVGVEVTGAWGQATLAFVPRARFWVVVTTSERAPYVFAVPAELREAVVFRLDAEGTLEVRAVDRDGSPSAGARVALLTPEEDLYGYEPDTMTREERADAGGVWRGRVQPRAYRLTVRGVAGESETKTTAVVRSGETTTVTVRMP